MKLADYFQTGTRDDGESFVTLTDEAPEWLQTAVREAHQGDMPNDWTYAECQAACEAIDSGDLSADDAHDHSDSRVDIYTKDLARWYADMCLSSTYCNAEAQAEDLGDGGTLNEQLMRIQYCAIEYIARTIAAAYEAQS